MQYFNLYRTTWYSPYFSVRGTRDCCSWLLSSVKLLHLRSFLYQRVLNLNLIFAFPCIRPGSAVWRFCLLKITCTGWYIRELSRCNVSPDNINKGGWGWNGTTGRFSSFITTFVFRASSRRVDEDSSVRTVSPCRLVDSYRHASCISVNTTRNTVCQPCSILKQSTLEHETWWNDNDFPTVINWRRNTTKQCTFIRKLYVEYAYEPHFGDVKNF